MFTTDVFEERSGFILRVEELLFSSEDGGIKVGKQLVDIPRYMMS
jgi:hypothetical protein